MPIQAPGIAGFATTVKELIAGTTRVSKHVPYYTGHLPQCEHGAAGEQGKGASPRNSFHGSTNLLDNFSSRVSGYTGYSPRAALYMAADVDNPRGVAADSEYDRASGMVEGTWAALATHRGSGGER